MSGVQAMRRAKFVLSTDMVAQALNLGSGLRVVLMHVTRDPDRLHVTVEGPHVPVFGPDGDDWGHLAWLGEQSAPVLPWPMPAGPRQEQVNVCRVDETVGAEPEPETVPELVDAGRPMTVQDAGAAAVGRAWESAVEAVRCGVPAATVLQAVEDAVLEGLRSGERELRQEVLAVVDRLRGLLTEQAGADKQRRR